MLPAAPHHRVDSDGDYQDESGGHFLAGSRDVDKVEAIGHDRQDEAADKGMDRFAAASRQACTSDDGCGYRVKDISTAVIADVDRPKARLVNDCPPRQTDEVKAKVRIQATLIPARRAALGLAPIA